MWRLKILTKILLSRLPFGYAVWQRLGLFRHGFMDQPDYPLRIFREHIARAFPHGLPQGFIALELGPGDSVASALMACACGASKIWLVDVGDFVTRDVAVYKKLAKAFKMQGLNVPDLSGAESLEDVLKACRAEYLTNGLESLESIPQGSVDMIWSQSVVEHISKPLFDETMRALHRALKPDTGRMTHHVDLKDHLGGALNNLRLSDTVWESGFFVKSGFYTNRLRHNAVIDSMRRAGFEILFDHCTRWSRLPTPKVQMTAPYRDLPEQELLIRNFQVVARR